MMNEVTEKTGRKNSAEWQALMKAYEASDVSQREFCRQHDVAYSTFSYWRRRLRSPVVQPGEEAAPLIELSTLKLPEGSAPWRVEIDLGSELRLRLR